VQLIFEFCRLFPFSLGKFAVPRWGPVRLWSHLNYYPFSVEQKAETCYDGVALFEIKRAENKLSSVYHSFTFYAFISSLSPAVYGGIWLQQQLLAARYRSGTSTNVKIWTDFTAWASRPKSLSNLQDNFYNY